MAQRACSKTRERVADYYCRHDTHTLAETSLLEETLPTHFRSQATHPGVKPLSYGETPLELVPEILDWAELNGSGSFTDLGCGCGAVVLTAAARARRALGVDLIPAAVEFGRRAAHDLGFENVEFREEDLLRTDLSSFDVVYCCATAISEWLAAGLSRCLPECRPGARVITVTHALESDRVKKVEEKTLRFSWGYLHSRSDWRFFLHHLS